MREADPIVRGRAVLVTPTNSVEEEAAHEQKGPSPYKVLTVLRYQFEGPPSWSSCLKPLQGNLRLQPPLDATGRHRQSRSPFPLDILRVTIRRRLPQRDGATCRRLFCIIENNAELIGQGCSQTVTIMESSPSGEVCNFNRSHTTRTRLTRLCRPNEAYSVRNAFGPAAIVVD